jgi:type II secretory pathway pseudopilin PulG
MKRTEAETRAAQGPSGRGRRNAFTLIELLVVLFLTGTLIAVAVASVFILGPKLNRASVAQLMRLASLTDAAEQFRADAAGAASTAEQVGPYRAGGDTLIFQVAGDRPGAPAYLLWHWDGSELWRIRWDEKSPKFARLGADQGFGQVTFAVEPHEDAWLVTMTLQSRREQRAGTVRERPVRLEVVGVLGADRE